MQSIVIELSIAILQCWTYAQVISQRGLPLQSCFGFVDGTVKPIASPDNNQRVVYNGHKRVRTLKFPSLALPNGITGHLYGPGRKYFCSWSFAYTNPSHWISPKRSVRLAQPLRGMFFTHTLAAYCFDGDHCSKKKKTLTTPRNQLLMSHSKPDIQKTDLESRGNVLIILNVCIRI